MKKRLIVALSIIISAALLYYLTSINYNLFHITIEIALLVIGVLIFSISVISQEVKSDSISKIFGFGLLTVSFMTLLHIVSYKGMNILPGYDANLPTQLWICINLILAINVLTLTIVHTKKINLWRLGSAYIFLGIVLTGLCLAKLFPDCYVEGVGITLFKKVSEYVIIFLYLLSLVLLWLKKNKFSKQEYIVSVIVILLLSISEFMFTLYFNTYDISNFMGHFVRLIAFSILLYHTSTTSIKKPYTKIFDDLQKSQEDVVKSEKKFRTMFEDSNSSMMLIDPEDGKIVLANPAACEYYGWSLEQITNMHIFDINILSQTQIEHEMAIAAANSRRHFNFRHRLASDEIRDVIVDSSTIIDNDKKLLFSIVHDNTNSINATKALKESENDFKLMFEDAPLPYQSLDAEGKFIIVNTAWLEMLGYKANEVIGKWFGDFIHPKYAEHFKINFPKFKSTGETCTFFKMKKKNGEEVSVNFTGRVGFDENGNFRQTHCIMQDVTEQVKAEALIRKKEEEQRLLLQQLQTAIMVHNTDKSIQYCNPLAEEILDISYEELLGMKSDLSEWQFFHESGEIMKIDDYPVSIVLRTKETLNHYVIGIKKDETSDIKWVDSNGFPIFNDSNEVERVLISFVDISHRIELEKNRLIIESQLRNQQKLESIGTLASGVAHEINNPINGIMNYSQLILDSSSEDIENKSYAEEIIHETNRVSEIVKNLLMFSRQETKQYSEASVEHIVEQTLSLIRTIIAKDQIQLEINIQKNLPSLQCRSQQIQQVLMNLMTNAKDALNEKYEGYHENKKIFVSAEEWKNNNEDSIRITVEDYGVGIPLEIVDKLFDPFFTTKPRDKGTGLGLSISYGIIKEHNGELTFKTEEGEFTRFIIDLPVKQNFK